MLDSPCLDLASESGRPINDPGGNVQPQYLVVSISVLAVLKDQALICNGLTCHVNITALSRITFLAEQSILFMGQLVARTGWHPSLPVRLAAIHATRTEGIPINFFG